MKAKTWAVSAVVLWGVSAVVASYMFVRGVTIDASDGRVAVVLEPAERDLVLKEMRTMLASVQGIVAGIGDGDLARAQEAARASGSAIAQAVPPALMAKLPLEFKQLGMEVHTNFDAMSTAVEQQETEEMLLSRLGTQLQNCVACHAVYRIQTEQDEAP